MNQELGFNLHDLQQESVRQLWTWNFKLQIVNVNVGIL